MINTLRQKIEKDIDGYAGEHERVIHHIPMIVSLVISLVGDSDMIQDIRLRFMASLGYLFLPDDLYPESEFGPIGYVEDIMLLIHLLREVERNYSFEYLSKQWDGDQKELRWLIDQGFDELLSSYGNLYYEVIDFMGF